MLNEIKNKKIFSNHNLLVFENKEKSKDLIETKKILINNKSLFKNLYVSSSIEETYNIINTNNISILFIDKKNTKHVKLIKNDFPDLLIFFLVKNINNELFTLKPDEFIFNASSEKELTILKLIHKHLLSIEHEKQLKEQNIKIIEQQQNIDKIFNLLSNNSLITKTDKEGKIIYVNELFKKITGYKKEEIIGKKHSILKHPDTKEESVKSIWEKLLKKEIWTGILKNKSIEGKDFIVDTKIIPELDTENNIIGFLSVQYDMTELFLKKELNQLMLDEQSNAIIIGQNGKDIISINNEFNNIFNKLNITDLFVNKSDISEEFLKGETTTLNNVSLYTIDKIKQFNIIQKQVERPFGKFFIISFIDVTLIQQEILNAKYEAHMKSNFLATMSHEIRTPLNGMIPYINLLLDNVSNLNQEQLEFLSIIKYSSENLLTLINDILDFSKIEAGKLDIENILFNPIKEFESVVNLYSAKANEKKITLLTFIDPTLPNYYGDSLRIKQIMNNLLSNAIKFTNENGKIEINITKEKNKLKISIKDNGTGIPEEIQNSIFDSFTQANNTISRNFGGTGLGLSISQNLANLMNSEIKLKSKIGKGSEFYFILSLKEEKIEPIVFLKKVGIYSPDKKFDDLKQNLIKYLKLMKINYKIIDENFNDELDTIFYLSNTNNCNIKHEKIVLTNYYNLNISFIYNTLLSKEFFKEETVSNNNFYYQYKANVLIAEDNSTNQKIVRSLFNKIGIEPVIVSNGELAVEEFKNNLYDLVLLDIHMPVMTGLEALKHIRELDENKNIIALTADAIKTNEEKFLKNGFTDFISKPININFFFDIIEKYLKDFKLDLINSKTKNICSENFIDLISSSLELDYETSKELYEDFISNWNSLKEPLFIAISNFDFSEIREISHSLKGASGSLSLNDCYEIFKKLEHLSIDKIKTNEYITLFNSLKI